MQRFISNGVFYPPKVNQQLKSTCMADPYGQTSSRVTALSIFKKYIDTGKVPNLFVRRKFHKNATFYALLHDDYIHIAGVLLLLYV